MNVLNPNPLYLIGLTTVLGVLCGSLLIGAAVGLVLVNLKIAYDGVMRMAALQQIRDAQQAVQDMTEHLTSSHLN